MNPESPVIMDGSSNLYGTTSSGGAYGYGAVFEISHSTGTITTLASFNLTDGADPYGGMVMDSSGNLYGTTYSGGASGDGTVFELAKGSGTIRTLASFSGANGSEPKGALIMAGSGNLYGTTTYGGASDDGTVFELTAGSGMITTLASFNGGNGANPYGGLLMDSGGNLYGTTSAGGPNTHGTVFELAGGSGTITTLASFAGTAGQAPEGGLIMDSGGNLYGTASGGGASKDGTVFELAHGSGAITTLASFNGSNGSDPVGGLVRDSAGNLYGTTVGGGTYKHGTVFELVQGGGTITTLASFNGGDGANPFAGLIMDASGNLYGTTSDAGPYPFNYLDGTVFELAHGSSQITLLASFFAPNGVDPGGLVMDSNGDLYGAAGDSGAMNVGTVFELAHGSSTLTTLASFNITDGADPSGGVIVDSSGNLYGTTYRGGAYGYAHGGLGDGTVFELVKGSGTITTLASFDGTDGWGPLGALIIDSSGNLYGTTAYGGPGSSSGTIFELAKGSSTITTLASFNDSDGAYPFAGLIMDASGNLYGTTRYGGLAGDGTVFELAQGSGTITTLASFNGANGANPDAPLTMDSSGNLYGTTVYGGGSGAGTVFEIVQGSGTITTLVSFNSTDGYGPSAAVIMDSGGNLYGTTSNGGLLNDGTVFELAKSSSTVATLASFNFADGAYPQSLLLDSSGDLYGTCGGGAAGFGTVFELPGAAAPTDQWTGANSAVDTNWSDGANWSLGTPPTAGQTALFTSNSNVHSFTSTVDAGFTNTVGGLVIDGTWGGTITVSSALTVTGNFILASGSFGGSGAVTVAGDAMQWTGGRIVVGSGGFTNTGVITADTTGGNLVLTGAGTLTNDGTITLVGSHSLLLKNTATIDNAAGATVDLTDNGRVTQVGGGTFTNAGTLEKSGGTGTSTISTTTLSNTGTVAVAGGTLDISATVTQVSGHTLTGGSWTVTGSPAGHARLHITSAGRYTTLGSAAAVTLSGPNASFPNVRGLVIIDRGASFSLLDGATFTTARALRNKGSLTLSPGSVLTVGGNFVEQPAGTLAIELGGTDAAPTFAQLVSTTGTVALAGSLSVTSTVAPVVGTSFEVLDNGGNSAISGTFAGLAEGATFTATVGGTTMTFQISYAATDDDGDQNVLITRIS
jgi:uncharacterized repeat protein (TIGR03803 family)